MSYREKILKEGNRINNLLHADITPHLSFVTSVTKIVGKQHKRLFKLEKRNFS